MTPLAYAWRQLLAGQYLQAIGLCDQVLASDARNVSALSCRAMARWSAGGSVDAALQDLVNAVRLAPGDGSVRHNYATVLASIGDFSGAAEQFRAALLINADDAAAFLGLTQCAALGDDDPDLIHFRSAHDAGALSGNVREMAGFALARVADANGDPERAMAYCQDANSLVARPYDAEAEQRRLDMLRGEIMQDGLGGIARNGASRSAPIFIVGMPRSGTTLIEALIAGDDGVFAAGETGLVGRFETDFVARLSRRQRYNGSADAALRQLSEADLRRGAEFVLREAEQFGGRPSLRVAEKTTENLLRIGLIAALFPDAKVINVSRHPLDCGLSNFFTRFQAGLGFSFSMAGIGQRMRVFAETLDLWQQSGLIDILDVSYEELVSNPADEAPKLFDFAGLRWNPAYLDVAGAQRTVRTASHWQVRQPISTRSVGRWKPYEKWLHPMIEAMGGMDWVEAAGY